MRDAIAIKDLIYRYLRLINSLTIFEKWYNLSLPIKYRYSAAATIC
jgi:hypothetical protein